MLSLFTLTAASFNLARWSMEEMTGNKFPPLVQIKMEKDELKLKVNGKIYVIDYERLEKLARPVIEFNWLRDNTP